MTDQEMRTERKPTGFGRTEATGELDRSTFSEVRYRGHGAWG